MATAIYFHDYNSGMQTGINNGIINAQFNLNTDPLDKLPIASGAEFGSYIDQHEDECLPGTRTNLLNEIAEWAVSPRGKCIFWLNGMAGTGKSTISRTVAKDFKQEGLLGASFFFRRGEGDRGNAMKLFSTVTRQIVKHIPQLMPSLEKAIYDEPDIATRSLKQQFDNLLLRPIQKLERSDHLIRTVVIVIDALDECEQDDDIRTILQLLPQLRQSNALSLRVFLTSRPELPIRLGFSEMTNHEYRDLALHQIPEAVTAHDISLFFKHRLLMIRKNQSLPNDWPGAETIQALITLSVPLFIFAATMCRILEDPQWDPVDSLAEILTHRRHGSQFNGTYLPVLNRLLKGQNKKQEIQLVEEFRHVIGTIVMLESPLPVISLSRLIGLPERRVSLRLKSLHSVLSIPEGENLPVRPFHLSFRDFLLDPETRDDTPFWVDEKETQQMLTTRCLLVMGDGLRKNICELPSDRTRRTEISPQAIHNCLSLELQYSCRNWAYHLVRSKDLKSMMHEALLFLQEHFLHWMEAMSVLNCTSDVVGIINLLRTVRPDIIDSTMSEFLHDAKRFILKNRQIADDAPLQLYCSGLIFAPRKAIIRRHFKTELPNWCYQLPQVEETWSPELQTLEGHSRSVQSVAFSSDGQLLASGSYDNTVRLWDPATGTLQQTLEGHSGLVQSVAFSPDGRLLASGSWDKTVRIWDPATGALQQTLDGHSLSVQSVAFSPDGRLLASGSYDKTVRLWDLATGALQQTLEGHSRSVQSVAFSLDGQLLASGSYDNTVRLWDPATGTLQQTLEGHSRSVQSVAFSPDGQLLASGSWDKTVRIWDPATGALQQTLDGHSDIVHSVVFSPDGRLLASGSYDNTVRLWDPATGALQQTFDGHSDIVQSVSFSPDGQLLASGSRDNTVRLWDPATGASQQTLDGHSGSVQSVAFSPDGRLLASGCWDKAVRLWDPATGTLQQTLEGHLDIVWSVAFSPDGRLLASGSRDNTVRLWDPAAGALRQTLNVNGYIDYLEFAQGSSYLITNLGPLDIQFGRENHASNSIHENREIIIDNNQWINLNGKDILWLPPGYRPRCSAIYGSLLALGHASGRISFIGFRV